MTTYRSEQSRFPGADWTASGVGVAGEYGVWFSEIRVNQFVNLRGDCTHPQFVDGVQRVVGVELPVIPNTVVRSPGLCCHWLGPNEWLITIKMPEASIMEELEDSLSGLHIAITDLTGGQSLLEIGGRQSRELLSAACTLDLHPDVFMQGNCAQTILAQSNVLITPTFASSVGCVYEVLVRRSYADHLIRWLIDAAKEDGFECRMNDDSRLDLL